MTAEVAAAWERLIDLTAGLTFEQDSMAIEECARLWVRQQAIHHALDVNPLDIELAKLALSNGRQLMLLWNKLGLTPRDRQSLLRPNDVEEPKDEFETLLEGN
jgi:hypothetical protein